MYRAFGRLMPQAQGWARVSLTVVASLLAESEVVVVVAQGWVQGVPGVVALTDRRLLVVNERPLAPTVISLTLDGDFAIQGWETPQAATVQVAKAGRAITLDAIFDRAPAYDLVNRAKARIAG